MNLFKTIRLFLKAKRLPVGATTQRKGGTWKKLGEAQWAPVGKEEAIGSYQERAAKRLYDSAILEGRGGHFLRFLLEEDFQVKTYADLKRKISEGPKDTAHKIFKQAKDYIDTADLNPGDKKRIVDTLGRALIKLRDMYGGAKRRLTIDVRRKTGGAYRKKPKGHYFQPSLKATTIKQAKVKLGGWSEMSKLPTLTQIRSMIKKKTATLEYGKINPRKEWTLKQDKGIQDVIVPFRETDRGITITLRQSKKMKQRTSRTAELKIEIPYVFAKEFLKNHVTSIRTRNELVRQVEASKGYKRFVEEKAA